jgi:plastocyanin
MTMRVKAAGIGMAVAAAVAGPGAGMAGAGAGDIRVVAAPGAATAGYATPQTVVQKGKALVFLNLDLPSHDVVAVKLGSNGAPLFKSSLIGVGKTAPVAGVNRLAPGTYAFFCSLHTNMKGKLKVV